MRNTLATGLRLHRLQKNEAIGMHLRGVKRLLLTDTKERTPMNSIKKLLAVLLGALSLAVLSPASAQTWPDKPIRWTVGYPPGGNNAIYTRVTHRRRLRGMRHAASG